MLLLRSGDVGNGAAIAFINKRKLKGVQIETRPCDVTDVTSLKYVLDNCARHMPPIKGCVQGSMLLRDAMFDNMSYNDSKAATTCWFLNLHALLKTSMFKDPRMRYRLIVKSIHPTQVLRMTALFVEAIPFSIITS